MSCLTWSVSRTLRLILLLKLFKEALGILKLAGGRLRKTALDRRDGIGMLRGGCFNHLATVHIGVHHDVTAVLANDGDW